VVPAGFAQAVGDTRAETQEDFDRFAAGEPDAPGVGEQVEGLEVGRDGVGGGGGFDLADAFDFVGADFIGGFGKADDVDGVADGVGLEEVGGEEAATVEMGCDVRVRVAPRG
jgi:hypothetical protein